jgi:hypothetical protein
MAYITDVGWREILVFYLVPFSGGPALIVVRALGAVAALGAVVLWRSGASGRRAVGQVFFGGLVLTYLTSLMGWYPLGYRYGLFAAPVLLVALAAGVAWCWARSSWIGAPLAVGVLAALVLFLPQSDALNRWLSVPREDLGPVLDYVVTQAQAGDAVYAYYGAIPAIRYYARGQTRAIVEGAFIEPRTVGAEVARIRTLATTNGRVWVVLSHVASGDQRALLDPLLVTPAGRPGLRITDHIGTDNAAAFALEPATCDTWARDVE